MPIDALQAVDDLIRRSIKINITLTFFDSPNVIKKTFLPTKSGRVNEEPRSKLRGITELTQSDLSEILAGLSLPLHVPFDSLPVGPLSHCRHRVPVAPQFPAP